MMQHHLLHIIKYSSFSPFKTFYQLFLSLFFRFFLESPYVFCGYLTIGDTQADRLKGLHVGVGVVLYGEYIYPSSCFCVVDCYCIIDERYRVSH